MTTHQPHQTVMRLYNERNERLYLNAGELARFVSVAQTASPEIRSFALTLAYTGCRLSEVRALRVQSVQIDARVVSVRSLKKRKKHIIREVPMPVALVSELQPMLAASAIEFLWSQHGHIIPRITAYRWIKKLMHEADIEGAKACPRGLRHAYGIRATLSGVPLNMLQLWMGHASMRTTAIYATALGAEQLELSDRMW